MKTKPRTETRNRSDDEQQREREFDSAFEQLAELVDLSEADEILPSSPQTVYTASVVLWLLIVQRLKKGCSLMDAVKHLLDTTPDLLPDNKRVEEKTLSSNTGAYSNGRARLTKDVVLWLAETVAQTLIDASPASFHGHRVFLFDGTTITLEPESELREVFPPASNQYGDSPWPLVHLVVAHELESGAALPPEVGAKNGPNAVSETSLISDHLRRIPDGSVILADSAYGIFRVAHAAHEANKHYVLRLTKARFRSRKRQATLVAEGPGWQTWNLQWKPTSKERKNNPQLPDDAELSVRIHAIDIGNGKMLYLVSDLPHDAGELAELYTRRWDVETDISNLKVVLDMENIRAKSEDMFYKVLMTSVVAYNLTSQFRRQAAEQAKVHPRRLSFTRTWSTFRTFLLKKISSRPEKWREKYRRALEIAKKDKIPNRPGRSYPREVYKRRPKSTHFKKRTTHQKPENAAK